MALDEVSGCVTEEPRPAPAVIRFESRKLSHRVSAGRRERRRNRIFRFGPGRYRVLPSFTEFYRVFPSLVRPVFTPRRYTKVLLGFTGFWICLTVFFKGYRFLLGFTQVLRVWSIFIEFYRVLPSFTEFFRRWSDRYSRHGATPRFYWVLLDYESVELFFLKVTDFYWVLLMSWRVLHCFI